MDRDEKIALAVVGAIGITSGLFAYRVRRRVIALTELVDVAVKILDDQYQGAINEKFDQIIEENGLD